MGLFTRSEPVSHFPPAVGKHLGTGAEVRFPDDLPADATLLVVAFRDDLDPLSDQWARLGDRLVDAHGDRMGVWELPVVNAKLKVFGKLATMGIRGQIHSEDERDRTVPLYVDTKAFRKALRLKTQGDVYAFLVDRAGRIAWRGEGDIDMEEVEALEHAVREVLDAPVPDPSEHPDVEAADGPPRDEPAAGDDAAGPGAEAAPPPEDADAGGRPRPAPPDAGRGTAADGAEPRGTAGRPEPAESEPADARWGEDPPPVGG